MSELKKYHNQVIKIISKAVQTLVPSAPGSATIVRNKMRRISKQREQKCRVMLLCSQWRRATTRLLMCSSHGKRASAWLKVVSLSSADNGEVLQTQETREPIGLYGT